MSSSNEPNPRMDEVKAIITLRSVKELKQQVLEPAKENRDVKEAELDEVVTKEPAAKNGTPPPFPQALKAKKKAINQAEAEIL